MSFDYLDGKTWAEVTRDERFFCSRLIEHIHAEGAGVFVEYLCQEHALDVRAEGVWEAGFEVCFYRDLWLHRGKQGDLYSPKRTFDLCLFGEKAILIIEAKAVTSFAQEQTCQFAKDIDKVRDLTGVDDVRLLGLCSSRYVIDPGLARLFNGPILRWRDLARRYGRDPVLTRADDVYESKSPFSGYGCNSDRRATGLELLEAHREKLPWWVGRQGGRVGKHFQDDLKSGTWQVQQYEVNTTADAPPSLNYFSLEDFVAAVRPAGVG